MLLSVSCRSVFSSVMSVSVHCSPSSSRLGRRHVYDNENNVICADVSMLQSPLPPFLFTALLFVYSYCLARKAFTRLRSRK